MLKYRDVKLIRTGFLGIVLVLLVVAVGLQPERLISWATGIRYSAEFAEAGGLSAGNDVKVSGVKVGNVIDVALGERGAVVTFTVDNSVRLGTRPPPTSGPGRCWEPVFSRWSRPARRRCTRRCDSDVANRIAVLAQ